MLKNKWVKVPLVIAFFIFAFSGAICLHLTVFGVIPLILASPEEWSAPPSLDLPITGPLNPQEAYHMGLVNQISDATFGSSSTVVFGNTYVLIVTVNDDLRIIDVSSPENPHVLASYLHPVDSLILDASLSDRLAILGTTDGIVVLDISDPKVARLIGIYKAPYRIHYSSIEGSKAYLVDEHSGFYILDLTNPTYPKLIAYYEKLIDINYISGIATRNDYVYLTGGEKVIIIDASDPLKLVESGVYNTHYGFEDSPTEKITVINNIAFLNEGYRNGIDPFTKSYLTILDISDPMKPRYIVTYDRCDECSFAIGGISQDLVYLQTINEIHLMDFTDPKNPVELGYYGLPIRSDWYTGVSRDSHIYLVDNESSFYNFRYLP